MPVQRSEWLLDDRPVITASPEKYPVAARLANSYWCPVGPLPGRAWLLMRRRDIAEIIDNGETFHRLSIRVTGAGRNTGTIAFPGLVICSARNISGGPKENSDAAYLVELADRRKLAADLTSVVKQYNVQLPMARTHPLSTEDSGDPNFGSGMFYAETLNTGPAVWDYTTIAEDLWTDHFVGVLGAWPGLSDTILPFHAAHPRNVIYNGVNAWEAMNQLLLYHQGHTTVYDPVDDKVSIRSMRLNALGEDVEDTNRTGIEAEEQKHSDLLYDADPLSVYTLRSPEMMYGFNHHTPEAGCYDDTVRDDNWLSDAWKRMEITNTIPGQVAGTAKAGWGDQPIVSNPNGQRTNVIGEVHSGQQPLFTWNVLQGVYAFGVTQTHTSNPTAVVWDAGYFFWPDMHRIYQGLAIDFRPSPAAKAMIWRDYGDGLMTEVMRWPGMPRRFRESDDGTPQLEWAIEERIAPLDLGRRSAPQYPELTQIVEVNDGTSTDGDKVSNNSRGLFKGKTVQISDNFSQTEPGTKTITEKEDCWLYDTDGAQDLPQGAQFIGRLIGSTGFGSDWRPLYAINTRSGVFGDVYGSESRTVAGGQLMMIFDNLNIDRESGVELNNDGYRVEEWGFYKCDFTAQAESSVNGAVVTFYFAPSVSASRLAELKWTAPADATTNGDKGNVHMSAIIERNRSQFVKVWAESTPTTTLTLTDARFTIQKVGGASVGV